LARPSSHERPSSHPSSHEDDLSWYAWNLVTRQKVTMSGGEEMPSWFDILGGPDRLQVTLHGRLAAAETVHMLHGVGRGCKDLARPQSAPGGKDSLFPFHGRRPH
jgi:hypothetical protein